MFAVKVKKEQAEDVRVILSQRELIDKKRKILRAGDYIEIPVVEKIKNYKSPKRSFRIVTQRPIFRYESAEPFERILNIFMSDANEIFRNLQSKFLISAHICSQNTRSCRKQFRSKIKMPAYMKRYLPRRWEKLGDVLVLKIPEQLEKFERGVAKTYAEILHAKTVVKDLGIVGEQRKQKIKIIFGDCTETVHKENRIKFKLDVNEVMFSSGNMKERKRISSVSNKNETVVDMFAGIGYFSIPLAFYSKPKQIRAYEINPVAYRYLCENIKLNRVRNIVVPYMEDCRNAEEGVADRIIMGYLKDTFIYFPKALRILKPAGGIIHYHENCPNALLPKQPFEKLKEIALRIGKKIELIKFINVKSYAPGVSHVVLDIKIK